MEIGRNLSYGVRTLRKTPGFTVLTIAILALGIGANTAIFSLVHAVLLRQLPYHNPDDLVWVWSVRTTNEGSFNVPDFIDYRDRNRTLESIAGVAALNSTLTGQGEPVRVQGWRVSAGIFQTLGITPLLGRTLQPDDDRPGAGNVVVLTYSMWRDRFGSDPQIVGRKLILDGTPYLAVGVLPRDFIFPRAGGELAIPLTPDSDPARKKRVSINIISMVGRLKPGAGMRQAQDDLASIARQLRSEYPNENTLKISVRVAPLANEMLGSARNSLEIVIAAASLLLLIVLVNVANSLFARAAQRRKEMAIRTALGATRVQIVAQSVTENMLLTLVGGGLGVLVAKVAVGVLLGSSLIAFPRANLTAVNGAALFYAGAISIFIGLLIGLVSARRSTNVSEELKSSGRGTTTGRQASLVRGALIVAEVGLSFALLIGAGLLSQSLMRLNRVDPGFDSKHLLAVSVSLPRSRYNNPATIGQFLRRADAVLDSEGRVQSHSVVSVLPLSGGVAYAPFSVQGMPVTSERRPFTNYRLVGPKYFETMGIALQAGVDFTDADRENSRPVALVNEQFAGLYLAGRSPVGAHLFVDDNDVGPREVEVIGVVGNVKQLSLDEKQSADLYIPVLQAPNEANGFLSQGLTIIVRTLGDPRQMTTQMKRVILTAEPDAALTPRAMGDWMAGSLVLREFQTVLMNAFAIFATLLAGFGLYGVMSYLTAQRLHEIGVRMALGATAPGIARLVIRQGLAFAAIGMGAGAVLALAGYRLIASRLYMTGLLDVLTFGASAALVLLIAAVASWVPALRAARVDPIVVLRGE